MLLGCNTNLITATYDKNQKIITHKQGEAFVIKLESSFGSGYQWDIIDKLDSTVVKFDSLGFERSKTNNDEKILGQKAYELFHFHTVRKGTTHIKFFQFRPWEKETPKDSCTYKLIVKN